VSLRDRIIAADDIGKELVEVPEWGVSVEVRTISTGMRSKMLKSAQTKDGEVDLDRLYPMLLIATVFDPELDEPVFSEDDYNLIQDKSAQAVERVAKKAMEMSGMVPDAVDEEGKVS
jgi:hypothetical protein